MIFKSKMILDPIKAQHKLKDGRTYFRGNRMGLTIGLTLHTPKFMNCRTYNFYCNQFDHMRWDGTKTQFTEEDMERRYLAKLAHSKCKRKHLSYKGYAYWTGPKRRYTFRYMGATHPRERWWKPFSIRKHNTYTRWLDNGPQNPPVTEEDRAVFKDEIWTRHREEFNAALQSAEDQMNQYEQSRGVIGVKTKLQ